MNYKELYRKVERTLARIDRTDDLEKTLSLILKSLVDDYGDLALTHFARQMEGLDPKRREQLRRLARREQ